MAMGEAGSYVLDDGNNDYQPPDQIRVSLSLIVMKLWIGSSVARGSWSAPCSVSHDVRESGLVVTFGPLESRRHSPNVLLASPRAGKLSKAPQPLVSTDE
jgi:hypothetical protein